MSKRTNILIEWTVTESIPEPWNNLPDDRKKWLWWYGSFASLPNSNQSLTKLFNKQPGITTNLITILNYKTTRRMQLLPGCHWPGAGSWVGWHQRGCNHLIHHMPFLIGAPCNWVYLLPFEIRNPNIGPLGSRRWPIRVMRCHRACDHLITQVTFPIGGPL